MDHIFNIFATLEVCSLQSSWWFEDLTRNVGISVIGFLGVDAVESVKVVSPNA